MPVDLPMVPALASVKPRLISFRADLQPSLGGPVQRVNRVGSRFAIDVQMPPLEADCARAWLAARLKAEAENDVLRLNWPQPGGALDIQGAVVDGAGQAGTALAVRGLAPAGEVPRGWFFSILYADGYRLHAATESVIADDQGRAVLSIAPMLRRSPADGGRAEVRPRHRGTCWLTGPPWTGSCSSSAGRASA